MVEAFRYKKEVCGEGGWHRSGGTFLIEETWIPSKRLAFNEHDNKLNVYRQNKPCHDQPAVCNQSRPLDMHKLDREDREMMLNNLKKKEASYNRRVEKLRKNCTTVTVVLDAGYVAGLEEILAMKELVKQKELALKSSQDSTGAAGNDGHDDTDANNKDDDKVDIYERYSVDHVSITHNTVFVTVMPDDVAKSDIEDNTGLVNLSYLLIE